MKVWVEIEVEVDVVEVCDDGSLELEVLDSYNEICGKIIMEAQEQAQEKHNSYIDDMNESYMSSYIADRREYQSRF